MSEDCLKLGLPDDICRALVGDTRGDRTADRPGVASTWTSSWTLPAATTSSFVIPGQPTRSSTPRLPVTSSSALPTSRSTTSTPLPRSTSLALYAPSQGQSTVTRAITASSARDGSAESAQAQTSGEDHGVNTGAIVAPFIILILVLLAVASFFTWRRRQRQATQRAVDNGGDTEKLWLSQPAETATAGPTLRRNASWLGFTRPAPPPARPPRPSMAAKALAAAPRRSPSAKRVPPPVVRESALFAATALQASSVPPAPSPSIPYSPSSPGSFTCRGDRRTQALSPLPPLPALPSKPLPAVTASPLTGRLETTSRPTTGFTGSEEEDERPLAYAVREPRHTEALRSKLPYIVGSPGSPHPAALVPGGGQAIEYGASPTANEETATLNDEDMYGRQSMAMSMPRSVGGMSDDDEELIQSRSRSRQLWPTMRTGAAQRTMTSEGVTYAM